MPKKRNNNNKRSKVKSVAVAYASEQKYLSSAPRRLRHTEFLGEVEGNTSFQVKSYALNPGLKKTFPWLHKQARGWQFYRFNKMTVRFVTRSPSDTAGSIIYVIDYRSQDPKPTNESQATNAYGSKEGAVWRDMKQSFDLRTAGLVTKWKQVRASTTAEDLINFDVGRLHVCTVGIDGTVPPAQRSLGKLYLDFEVEFKTPELNDPDEEKDIPRAHSELGVHAEVLPIGGANTQRRFFEVLKCDGLKLFGEEVYDPVAQTFLMPKGHYRIHIPQTIRNTTTDAARHSILPLKNGVTVGAAKEAHSAYSAMVPNVPSNKTSTSFVEYFDGVNDLFSLWSSATAAAGAITSEIAGCLISLL